MEEEIEFLLTHASRYLIKDPAPHDVLSMFAGLRPLAATGNDLNSAAISRDHVLHISRSGLVTITGGKWTTYRRMAEDTVDQAALLAQLEHSPSVTHELPIHGYHKNADMFGDLEVYGSDAPAIQDIIRDTPENQLPLHPELPTLTGEVVWAVRNEMARTVEDFLSRRTRSLLLNARASIEMAPKVAELMAEELKRDSAWKQDQVKKYEELANGYFVK